MHWPAICYCTNPAAVPLMQYFLRSGQMARATKVLKESDDIPLSNVDGSGLSPLHYACVHGNMV
jgi:hypothetical protein